MRIAAIALALGAACPFLPQQPQRPGDAARAVPVEVGKAAPAFRLNDHTGRAVAIGGPREEWTVVAFFPKAMTPG